MALQHRKYDFSLFLEEKGKLYREHTRTWLFDLIKEWMNTKEGSGNNKNKVFWLVGDGGTGKTIVSTKLIEILGEKVIVAHHFFRHDNPSQHNTADILASLSAMFATNCKEYGDSLKKVSEEMKLDFEGEKANNNIGRIFDILLYRPLHGMRRPKFNVGMIIDALDEQNLADSLQFLEFLSRYFSTLPDWLRIIVTSRKETKIMEVLRSKVCPHFRN